MRRIIATASKSFREFIFVIVCFLVVVLYSNNSQIFIDAKRHIFLPNMEISNYFWFSKNILFLNWQTPFCDDNR
jgi:hypothetical protein